MTNYLALEIPGFTNPIFNPALPVGKTATGWQTLQLLIDWGLKAFYIGIIVYSFMNLIMGGISWIQSEGDKEKLKKAQDKMKVAVIGFVLAMLIFAGMYLIRGIFGPSFGLPQRESNCYPTEVRCRQDCFGGTCDFEPACGGQIGSGFGFVCRP